MTWKSHIVTNNTSTTTIDVISYAGAQTMFGAEKNRLNLIAIMRAKGKADNSLVSLDGVEQLPIYIMC